jgi:ParB-like chromosome segregation protein Spo0J
MTQEALAEAVGKDRVVDREPSAPPPAAPRRAAAGVGRRPLSMGQARALVALENPVTLKKAADDVVARALSVRGNRSAGCAA